MSEIEISSIHVGDRFRRSLGDIGELARSIELSGLLHPVVVTSGGELVAGYRRIEAFKQLGHTTIPATVIDPRDIRLAECHENMVRMDFQPSEMVEIGRYLEPEEREAAKERMVAGRPCGKFPQGKARDKVAAFVGVSGRTLEKATKVIEAAEANPNRYAAIAKEMDRTGKIDASYRKVSQDRKRAERMSHMGEPPDLAEAGETYGVLLGDPPWRYEYSIDSGDTIEQHYPTMTTAEICALPVSEIAGEDSVLFLWATSPKLPEALSVMAAWGFQYRTCLVWVKDWIGPGYYARQRHELLLVGKKGNPPTPEPSSRPDSVIEAPRKEHSAKPPIVYEIIERMYPDVPKVELFARNRRENWDSWGNEVAP